MRGQVEPDRRGSCQLRDVMPQAGYSPFCTASDLKSLLSNALVGTKITCLTIETDLFSPYLMLIR